MEKANANEKMRSGFKKKLTFVIGAVLLVAGISIWSNSGIYDHRNFPSKIRVFAKAQPGYHVHVVVDFYRARNIRGVCNPLIDVEGDPFTVPMLFPKEEIYNDISDTGIVIVLKKDWVDLCKYQLDRVNITCSKNLTYSPRTGMYIKSVSLYPYEKMSDTTKKQYFREKPSKPLPYKPGEDNFRIPKNKLNILYNQGNPYFFPCEKDCEAADYLAIDSTDQVLNLSCQESEYAF